MSKIKNALEKYVIVENGFPQYFIHLTNTEGKIGINPKTSYSYGIYGYPLDYTILIIQY